MEATGPSKKVFRTNGVTNTKIKTFKTNGNSGSSKDTSKTNRVGTRTNILRTDLRTDKTTRTRSSMFRTDEYTGRKTNTFKKHSATRTKHTKTLRTNGSTVQPKADTFKTDGRMGPKISKMRKSGMKKTGTTNTSKTMGRNMVDTRQARIDGAEISTASGTRKVGSGLSGVRNTGSARHTGTSRTTAPKAIGGIGIAMREMTGGARKQQEGKHIKQITIATNSDGVSESKNIPTSRSKTEMSTNMFPDRMDDLRKKTVYGIHNSPTLSDIPIGKLILHRNTKKKGHSKTIPKKKKPLHIHHCKRKKCKTYSILKTRKKVLQSWTMTDWSKVTE